jgi:hypothetical protein
MGERWGWFAGGDAEDERVPEDLREEFFAWEEEGALIVGELQGVWGVRVDFR